MTLIPISTTPIEKSQVMTDEFIPKVRHVAEAGKQNSDSQHYVGRPSEFGNPYVIGKDGTRDNVVELFKEWFFNDPDLMAKAVDELKGKDLVCWCAPWACHADILLEYVNR